MKYGYLIIISTLIIILFFNIPLSQAANPNEMLKDQWLEQRAEKLGHQIRCVVCQSESIEDSTSDFARNMRIIIREQIKNGQNDKQVMEFIKQRYGDYVLLTTPFIGETYILWLGPIIFLILALWFGFISLKKDIK